MDREQEIRHIAYQLWEEAGRPFGRDLEFYYKAEAILMYHHRHGEVPSSFHKIPVGARRS
jgi:hypothetical protein